MSESLVSYNGGGWYELPDGEKVQGREKAIARLSENGTAHSHETAKRDRIRFARQAGLQYGGDRDIYEVAGYEREGNLDFDDYWSRYERQDIAGRLVDMAPKSTWRNAPEVREPEREESDFQRDWEEIEARDDLRLWYRLEQADRLSRVGRFGLLFIGQRTVSDDALSEEMETMDGPQDIAYLSSYDEGDVEILDWDREVGSPRFGLPTMYQVDLSSGVSGFSKAEARVHWSRVIHIAEDPLSDDVFGRPALKRAFNRLFDLEKVTASTAEAFWQLADKILVASIDPDASMSDDAQKALGEAMEEMIHDLRRQISASGIDLDWLGGDTPDPTGPADLLMTLIASSATPSMPKRVLFGSETGERASTEDKKTWHEAIQSRIETHAEPVILRPFINRLVKYGAVSDPAGDEYMAQWPNLFEVPEAEEAEIDALRAEAAASLTPVGGDPMERVRITDEGRVELEPTEGEE